MRVFILSLLWSAYLACGHRMQLARLFQGNQSHVAKRHRGVHSIAHVRATSRARHPNTALRALLLALPNSVGRLHASSAHRWHRPSLGYKRRPNMSLHSSQEEQLTPRSAFFHEESDSGSIVSKLQRRSLLLGSMGLITSNALPVAAKVTNDVPSITHALPPEVNKFGDALGEGDKVPLLSTSFESPNSPLRFQSLGSFFGGSFLGRGYLKAKYVVLCFFPTAETRENVIEAASFQAREEDFKDIETVVVACSSQTGNDLRANLIEKHSLTLQFLSDPEQELITAFGAKSPKGDTCRSTVIIGPRGAARWIDRNVELAEFPDYARRVYEVVARIRNSDSLNWPV